MKKNGLSAKDMIDSHASFSTNFDPLQSLKLSVHCKLTKRPYGMLQSSLGFLKNTKVLATYNEVKLQKQQCYPENIVSKELEVYSDVKSILEKFVER